MGRHQRRPRQTSLDRGAKRVPAGEVLAPGGTRPSAVVFPRWELPSPLPVQTAHLWVTAAGARCLPPLGWVSFHPTLALQSAPEGPRLPASTKEDVPAPSKGTQAKLGEFSLGGSVPNADLECQAGSFCGCHEQLRGLRGLVSHLHRGHCGSVG